MQKKNQYVIIVFQQRILMAVMNMLVNHMYDIMGVYNKILMSFLMTLTDMSR